MKASGIGLPFPGVDFIELLPIDDHVGIQRLPISQFPEKPWLRDSEVFDQFDPAPVGCASVGLIQHEKKRKRNQVAGAILGADFDARSRIPILSLIILQIVKRRACTPRLLSVLLGCWIHVILFRRTNFVVIEQLFKEGQGIPQDQIFTSSRQACCQLQYLAVLAPVAQSDLRVNRSPHLYCTAASPTGGAVISANIAETASQKLWRYSKERGFHARLQSSVDEILSEKGFGPESNQLFTSKDPLPTHNTIPVHGP